MNQILLKILFSLIVTLSFTPDSIQIIPCGEEGVEGMEECPTTEE